MPEPIYIVDPITNEVQQIESVSFTSLNVKERQGLQEWVLQNPKVLGEELLIVTSEFDRFDKSNRRLDVLALDRRGTLVVVELKLDTNTSLADLQAVRYAAFCSTMQIEELVGELARYEGLSDEDAEAKIIDFVESDALPSLGDEPRIILAAGSINDQELTSCVLWLRRFGVDITCVELTPYKLPDAEQIMLVPRVIIPLPEARDYIVSVEKKEAVQRRAEASGRSNEELWRAVAQSFNELGLPFRARTTRSNQSFSSMRFGDPDVHYEWMVLRRKSALAVALHFEYSDQAENDRLLQCISEAEMAIREGTEWGFEARRFGKKWASAEFLVPYDDSISDSDIAPVAANAMRTLIERTWPLIRGQVRIRDEFKGFLAGS